MFLVNISFLLVWERKEWVCVLVHMRVYPNKRQVSRLLRSLAPVCWPCWPCWLLLGESPLLLQKASVKIIDTNTCNAEEAYNGRIEDTMLCAGYMEGNIDACQVGLEIVHKDHIMEKQLFSCCGDHHYGDHSVLHLAVLW